MSLLWKKRNGLWEPIINVSKKYSITDGETGESKIKYNPGSLYYKKDGSWQLATDYNKDVIFKNNTDYQFESTTDGDMVHLYSERNMYICKGSRLITYTRCKGLVLHVDGDLVIEGTITMTARGAKAEGRYVGIDYVNSTISISEDAITNPFLASTFKVKLDNTLCDNCNQCITACSLNAISLNENVTEGEVEGEITTTVSGVKIDSNICIHCGDCVDACTTTNALTKVYDTISNHYIIHPTGGLGLTGPRNSPGVNGACGSGGGTGSGTTGARGGNGTSFSGGAGAGGGATSNRTYGYSGNDNGGAGGNGVYNFYGGARYTGGGGAGNPGGNYCSSSGTGGLIICIVKGKIIVTKNGKIVSSGSRGGNKSTVSTTNWKVRCGNGTVNTFGFAGAGSGGGAIHLFYGDSFENYGDISAPGGDKGIGERPQYAAKGGDGTIHIAKVLADGNLWYPTVEEQ